MVVFGLILVSLLVFFSIKLFIKKNIWKILFNNSVETAATETMTVGNRLVTSAAVDGRGMWQWCGPTKDVCIAVCQKYYWSAVTISGLGLVETNLVAISPACCHTGPELPRHCRTE